MAGLTIWCDTTFAGVAAAALQDGLAGHHLLAPADPALATADVAFGQPDPEQVIALPRLRWLHLSTAGYTPYDRADVRQALHRRGAVMTKSSNVFDQPCAEHVLALIMAQARQVLPAYASQGGDRAWPQWPLRARCQLLAGQTVALFGFGSIARRLVDLLHPLRMNLVGIRRHVAGDEPVHTISVSDPSLPAELAAADHVVNLLPGSADTRRFFDAARFAALKPGAIFYNIGRGATVDQSAIRAALKTGWLAAAYLDVTDPEPLPPEDPLWTAPNCYITPHTAGGHENESLRVVQCFLDNLHRFADGRPLSDRVVFMNPWVAAT